MLLGDRIAKAWGIKTVRSEGDARHRFAAVVGAIYDAATAPERWPLALQAIADYFGDVGTVLFYQRDDGSLGTIVSPALELAQRRFEERWVAEDFRNVRAIEQGFLVRQDALTDRHVATPEEIETHPIYTQFLVPHGLGWFAATRISPDPHILVWISVQRSRSRQAFSQEELGEVGEIGCHAESALRLSMRLMDAEAANLGLREALARLDIGVFAVDGVGQVVFANDAAERTLGNGLELRSGRLTAQVPSDRAVFDGAVAGGLEEGITSPTPLLVTRPDSSRPLVVYMLPLRSSHPVAIEQFLTRARALLLVIDTESQRIPDATVVRDLLGLTLGEARVATLIASGLPPRAAAEQLGISETTARTVLKRVFAKSGLSRQSELAAALSRLAAGRAQA
jgi:DNA-binding CsgD family transcriptional regulator/PAS domain-containing protein